MKNQIITVNDQDIQIINSGEEKIVPIRPICDALGVDYSSQYTKLKDDEQLSSTIVLSTMVAADNKKREMVCLPLRYVFGWLFLINPNNVHPDVKESVKKYRLQCYDALFDVFTKRINVLKEKAEIMIEAEKIEKELEATEPFKKLQQLKLSMRGVNKRLTALDKSGLDEQFDLFKKQD